VSDTDDADRKPPNYDLLRRVREARRTFQHALSLDVDAREQMFSPEHLLETLRKHVDLSALGTASDRCGRLFVLTVLLYASLDWHFAGLNVDVEGHVRTERIRQNYRYGGAQLDDRLSPKDWHTRMRAQILRLEQQLAVEEFYAERLVKLTALAQAALEAASRQLHS
jgi:hypothetical protein